MMDGDAIDTLVSRFQTSEVIPLGEERKIVLLPEGMSVQDISGYLPPPSRIKQAVTLLTVKAFLEYVNRYSGISTTIFANEAVANYEAVFDYHQPLNDGRGDCDHIASYKCPLSDQWLAWKAGDGKWFEQTDFARFLETNLPEIVNPPGAVFLQVALQLQIHKSAEFSSEVVLENGQTRFRYEETLRSGGKKAGDIEIPSAFTLALPVFVDGPRYEMKARFRYKMDSGKAALGYELIRPKEVWNAAVKSVTAEIDEGSTCHLYAGVRS